MFARLSKTCSRLIREDDSGDASSASSTQDLLPSDVQALSQLSLPVPGNALETVAAFCGKVFCPLCHYACSAMSTDVKNIVASLHEADPAFAVEGTGQNNENEDIYVIPFPSSREMLGTLSEGSAKVCEAAAEHSFKFPDVRDEVDSHLPRTLKIPTIVVTPAPPQFREMSSCVPLQDTSFGTRLSVPYYSTLNAMHPPMVVPSYLHSPMHASVRVWTYKHGHWCAVAPGLDEQERRGIFSRPVGLRRRSMRKRAVGGRDAPLSWQNVFGRSRRDS